MVLVELVMAFSRDAFRRWFGATCLGLAAGMVIVGQTVLRNRLQGVSFMLYWLGCIVLTWVTLIVALLDMRAVRKRSRREQTELIQNALKGISDEKQEPRNKTG
jgi:hypothetical protein